MRATTMNAPGSNSSTRTARARWLRKRSAAARPDGKTSQIALKKRAADGQSHGSLFINPGGPGGSGIERSAQERSRWAGHQCADAPPL